MRKFGGWEFISGWANFIGWFYILAPFICSIFFSRMFIVIMVRLAKMTAVNLYIFVQTNKQTVKKLKRLLKFPAKSVHCISDQSTYIFIFKMEVYDRAWQNVDVQKNTVWFTRQKKWCICHIVFGEKLRWSICCPNDHNDYLLLPTNRHSHTEKCVDNTPAH